jgi:starvation-inducible DNA-binding protein
METTTTPGPLPPLGAHVRTEVGNQLQATLVELIDLSLYGKQLHWSVVGTEFRALHLQLDELVDSWREIADTVAERAVAIGYWPDGQAAAVSATGATGSLDRGAIPDREVVRSLAHRLSQIAERVRERLERVGELDAVSEDVLIDVIRTLEQQLWMVRAQIPLTEGPAR